MAHPRQPATSSQRTKSRRDKPETTCGGIAHDACFALFSVQYRLATNNATNVEVTYLAQPQNLLQPPHPWSAVPVPMLACVTCRRGLTTLAKSHRPNRSRGAPLRTCTGAPLTDRPARNLIIDFHHVASRSIQITLSSEFGPEWIAHSARPREINEFGRRQADCSVRVYEIAMLFPVLARGGHHCDDNDKFCQHFNCGGRLRRQMYTFFLLLRCCTPTWKHEQAG